MSAKGCYSKTLVYFIYWTTTIHCLISFFFFRLQAFISRGQCIWRAAMDDLIAQGQLTIVHPCCSKFLPLCVQIYFKIRHGRTWKLEVAMVNWPELSSAPLSSRTQVHRVLCYAEWSLLVGVWVEATVRGGRRLRAGSRTRTRRLATGHRQPPRTSTSCLC